MGLFSQPCGIKRTIDQVADDTSADYNIISCQPWQRQPVPYFHPGKQVRDTVQTGHDEPMCFNRCSSPDAADGTPALGHDVSHSQATQVEPVSGSQVYSVECSSSVAQGFTTTALSMRSNFNSTTFKYTYASGDMYSPVAKDELHNANKQHNESVIDYGQQAETLQVAQDRFRESDFCSRQPSATSSDYRKRYDDPSTTQAFSNNTQEPPKAEDKYWSFAWNMNCPKRTQPGSTQQAYYSKPSLNNYNSEQSFTGRDAFQDRAHVQVAEQQIQCDENGKSYIELSGKTAFSIQEEWTAVWNPAERQNAYSAVNTQQECNTLQSVGTDNTMNEESRNWHSNSQSVYRHQRLSILSLSMFKLNRFRQCSDPSLHKSVLICNTLRQIEDEMEREEFLTRRPKQKTRGQHQSSSHDCYNQTQNDNGYESNSVTTKFQNERHSNHIKKDYENGIISNNQGHSYAQEFDNSTRSSSHVYVFRRNADYDRSFTSLEVTQQDAQDKSVPNSHIGHGNPADSTLGHNEEIAKYIAAPVANEPARCVEENNREIDWGSVLTMSSAGLECLNSNSTGVQQTHQPLNRSDFIPSEASFFVTNGTNQAYNEHASSWKDNQYASTVSVNPRHSLSDFTVLRRRSELADELDGFVQILVGS